jgi:acyl-coenzyme A synthetase/AMP-(fatty) acid ligase
VEFIAALPKSVVGKILRRELRDMEAKKAGGKA